MRAFIAIELPKEIKDSLGKIQEQLKESGADVKWVLPQNIHLTLKFLGEIDDKKLEKIVEIIKDTIKDKNPFEIRISCIGAFPKINFPRVIWVGIDKGDSETKKIAKELEEKIAKVGIPREDRAFSSHITIGRTRSALNREKLVQTLETLASKFGEENLALHKPLAGQSAFAIRIGECAEICGANYCGGLEFSVTRITLFKSTLTPKGPIYEVLKEESLATN